MVASDDEVLERAMDAWMDGDVVAAKRLLGERLAADPGDPDARALLNEIEVSESLGAQGYGDEESSVPFACLGCGNSGHEARDILLNTRGLSLVGYDALNRAADCLICRTCGLVHWFLRAAPGAYQALHPMRRPSAGSQDGMSSGGCLVCGHDKAYPRSHLVNTRGLTLLGLEFLNSRMHGLVCERCGFMHWHDREDTAWVLPPGARLPPDPPLHRRHVETLRDQCLACGGQRVGRRKALLNSRGLTFFGLDWANQGATLSSCRDCRHVSWFA